MEPLKFQSIWYVRSTAKKIGGKRKILGGFWQQLLLAISTRNKKKIQNFLTNQDIFDERYGPKNEHTGERIGRVRLEMEKG